jgi:diketogulonate reductase-like aldo/keto reductase
MNRGGTVAKSSSRMVALPSGEAVTAFGMGTWHMAEDPARGEEELATLRLGLELGVRLIDTAEMYGDGRSEELAAEAMKSRREEVFLVDKVLPSNASRTGTITACERSLRRLKTDRIDLYLLHWRGDEPFSETMEAFLELRQAGKIRYFGVSNLDLEEMKEFWSVPGGKDVQTNQLLYNLSRRNIEWNLLPWLRRHHIPVMAYSPIEQARLLQDPKLIGFARQYEMTPSQAALSWLLAKEDVIVVPKTSNRKRLRENIAALDHPLTPTQLSEIGPLFSAADRPEFARNALRFRLFV